MGRIEDMIARATELDEGFGGDFGGLTQEWQGLADTATARIAELENMLELLEAEIADLKAETPGADSGEGEVEDVDGDGDLDIFDHGNPVEGDGQPGEDDIFKDEEE
jgi:hypothetical protein